MAENTILPWAQTDDANILSDTDYATDLATGGTYVNGVTTGQASSKQANKTWRQATAPAAGLGQFLTDSLSVDVTDADTPATFSTRIANAVLKLAQISNFNASFATATGGYKKYAVVSDSSGNFWVSTADNNTTTPGASGASWQSLFDGYATETYVENSIVDGLGLASSKSDPGYSTLPGGLIIQYGRSSSGSGGNSSISFPIAFPSACVSVTLTESGAGGTWPGTGSGGRPTVHGMSGMASTTAFGSYSMEWDGSTWTGESGLSFSWQAIGY